ncbi:hypothetical protein ACIRPH_31630 [Nocardiopsis sp. NPDC101807]|uniref:hypothetical protein n=1 Tax=Nocardiopsis sp. NPDC101807 TaxID=3364339 RepID=UPI00380122CC
MSSNHTVSFRTKSGTELERVVFSFAVAFSDSDVRDRPLREGRGFSVELPAVLDLLDAVAAGQEKATDVRSMLLDAVDKIYDSASCYEYETHEDKLAWCKRDGGCRTCERSRRRFARHLETMAERWRRWTLHDEFPFAVGNSKGLHTVGCSVVRRHMPDGFITHEPGDEEALRAFAHADDDHDLTFAESGWASGDIPFRLMSAEETRAWMAENTGPKGGRHYKRCRVCAPTP